MILLWLTLQHEIRKIADNAFLSESIRLFRRIGVFVAYATLQGCGKFASVMLVLMYKSVSFHTDACYSRCLPLILLNQKTELRSQSFAPPESFTGKFANNYCKQSNRHSAYTQSRNVRPNRLKGIVY